MCSLEIGKVETVECKRRKAVSAYAQMLSDTPLRHAHVSASRCVQLVSANLYSSVCVHGVLCISSHVCMDVFCVHASIARRRSA